MVKKKGKVSKKAKVAKRKRASSFSDEEVSVATSLPPAVEGQLRCFLRVSVPRIRWTVPHHPEDVQVRLQWWGEDGDGILFRPADEGIPESGKAAKKSISARYPVCSGPKQFAAYLRDMGYLVFEVVHGPSLILLGKAELANLEQLSAKNPIHGSFPVMSGSAPSHQLAEVDIIIRFESMSAAYNRLSSSAVPTVDTEWGQGLRSTDTSDLHPTPPPSLTPTTPMTHPRQKTDDLFVSPAPVKAVKFSDAPPVKVDYTSNQLRPAPGGQESSGIATDGAQNTAVSPGRSAGVLSGPNVSTDTADLIGTLLERGDRLRKAMAVFSLEKNGVSDLDIASGLDDSIPGHVPPGRLFKEILTSDKHSKPFPDQDPEEDLADYEPGTEAEGKAVDLVLGEEEGLAYLSNSPHPSPESSDVSDTEDPLYDESLLRDLFYTTPAAAVESDSETTSSDADEDEEPPMIIVSSDPETAEGNKRPTSRRVSPRQRKRPKRLQQSPRAQDAHATQSSEKSVHRDTDAGAKQVPQVSPDASLLASSVSSNLVESLGIETLTALGRINSARVVLESLTLQQNPASDMSSTYFAEYHFPVASRRVESRRRPEDLMEVTRVASRKVREGVVLFAHRSVFPVQFDATVTDQWWRLALTFRLFRRESGQRLPSVLGTAALPLRSVLHSDTLSCSAAVDVTHQSEAGSTARTTATSSSDPVTSRTSGDLELVGKLQVKIELLPSDGREIHLQHNSHRKPPLPRSAGNAAHPPIRARSPSNQSTPKAERPSPGPRVMHVASGKPTPPAEPDFPPGPVRESITLFTLLWIPEGKGVSVQGCHGNGGGAAGLVARSNLYLVCRMFWCEEKSISSVCWGTSEPQFGFRQVAPVQLTATLLQRACNNFVVVEVWDKSVHEGDKLVGIIKLPLHQFYLSYRDPKITKTLLKSKYPVVAVDEWQVVTNPFSGSQHGQLRVMLAMGSEEQVSSLVALKTSGDVPVEPHSRTDHHLDSNRDSGQNRALPYLHNKSGNLVEHQFEVVVEDIRGLSVFGSTVWGETDCFVQYHFPRQRPSGADDEDDDDAIPTLKPHRTATTLCVPEPAFHDVARHTFVLRAGMPVQRMLLAAFTGSWLSNAGIAGSWLSTAGIAGSGSVPFELWRRYYYPNARDQLVAKAHLPLAKLCAMVTMQKSTEPCVQTFSLPISVLPGEAQAPLQGRVQDTGLLDVTVRYRQSKRAGRSPDQRREKDDHVGVVLEVTRACGLKAAALNQCQSYPVMSYPAEVGVSSYVVVNFPVGKKRTLVTRTAARTFCADFSWHAELQLPLFSANNATDAQRPRENHVSLAEQLETREVSFEIWHQTVRGARDNRHTGVAAAGDWDEQPDVLLGTVRVPLVKLLTRRTGIRGWHAVHPPSKENGADPDKDNDMRAAVGGLDLSLKFAESDDRDDVIHKARALGWSPPRGCEVEDWAGDDEEDQSSVAGGVALHFKVDKAWLPLPAAGDGKRDKSLVAYARYKFYDKRPVCTRLATARPTARAGQLAACELRHSSRLVVAASPALAWFLSEERLEVQLWLGRKPRQHDGDHDWQLPRRRDRMVGVALVDLSSLALRPGRHIAQISGLFPLFKAGAEDLRGACVHVQIEATRPGGEASTHHAQQEDARAGDDDVSSDEYVSSEPRDDSQETRSLLSSGDPPHRKADTVEEGSDQTADRNTFPAHVIIERALHLPTVVGPQGGRIEPNVYVSYQVTSSSRPECTPVMCACTSPQWEYQKLQRLVCSPDSEAMSLHFKIWHKAGAETQKQAVAAAADQQVDVARASATGTDHVIGFASVDLAPLSAGMRQLNGWYNIVDFNGQCKGQLKVGIVPVSPLSPSRCLTRSVLTGVSHKQGNLSQAAPDEAAVSRLSERFHAAAHVRYERAERQQLVDTLSGELEAHLQSLRRLRNTGAAREPDEPAATDRSMLSAWTNSSCSTSLLFGQLRHNMKELDELQRGLVAKLGQLDRGTVVARVPSPTPSQTTDHLQEPGGGERVPSETSDENKPGEAGAQNDPAHSIGTDKPSETFSTTRSRWVEHDGSNEPAGEREISRSGLERNYAVGEPEGSPEVSNAAEPVAGDFPEATREENNEVENNADENNDNVGASRSGRPAVEDCSGEEDSDSLEEVSHMNDNNTYAQERDSWISSDDDNVRRGRPEAILPGDDVLRPATDVTEAIHYITSLDPAKRGASEDRAHEEVFHDEQGGIDRTNTARVREDFENLLEDFGKNPAPCEPCERQVSDGVVSDTSVARNARSVRTIPNFFLPTEQLEQSMRALRLAARSHPALPGREDAPGSKSRLLSRSAGRTTAGSGGMAEEFAKRKLVYKERGDPPISNNEAQRIARIFSSKNST